MDRREALKKLGAAGVIVVGGSAVLSSQSVAFAASAGVCIATIPNPISLTITQPNTRSRVGIAYTAANTLRVTTTYRWSSPKLLGVPPPAGGIRIRSGATTRTVSLQRTTTPTGTTSKNWVVGELFSVLLTITWSCTRPTRSDVASYLVTSGYAASSSPRIVSVAKYS